MKKTDPISWVLIAVLWAAGGHYFAHWDTGQMVVYGACAFAGCLTSDAARFWWRRRKYRQTARR